MKRHFDKTASCSRRTIVVHVQFVYAVSRSGPAAQHVPQLVQIVQRRLVVGRYPQRVLVAGQRLAVFAVQVQHGSQVAVATRVLRTDRRGKNQKPFALETKADVSEFSFSAYHERETTVQRRRKQSERTTCHVLRDNNYSY